MKLVIIAGLGGFIGTVLRYLTVRAAHLICSLQFPYGTLAVNILGCLAIGVIFSLAEKGQPGLQWRSFLVTGICGGYTTFSAFSVETIELIRSGQPGAAVLYIALSVFLGLLATLAGITIVKLF